MSQLIAELEWRASGHCVERRRLPWLKHTRTACAERAFSVYDDDGDQDIALISAYPRWEWEEPHTFAYLENQGGFEFAPSSLAREHFGVWTSVEAADVNADGKPDIVLGLGNWPTFVPSDWPTRQIVKERNGEVPTITFLLNDH